MFCAMARVAVAFDNKAIVILLLLSQDLTNAYTIYPLAFQI